MPEYAVGKCALHIKETGRGFPVFFGHSLSFCGRMFDTQAAALSERYRCLQLDFRGHGRSGKPDEPITLDQIASEVMALADALRIDRFHWIGLSMGGMTGMRIALAHPERVASLVLMDTNADAEEETVRPMYVKFAKMTRDKPAQPELVEMTLDLMFSAAFRDRAPIELDLYRQQLMTNHVNAVSQVALAVVTRESIVHRLPEIRCPTRVMVGSDDTATIPAKSEQIAAAIPGARLEIIPGAGHMSAVESPELTTRLIGQFLKEVGP